MANVSEAIKQLFDNEPIKIVLSHPRHATHQYRKVVIERKNNNYFTSQYTEKQVFHVKHNFDEMQDFCLESIAVNCFSQINAWNESQEFFVLISKKGKVTIKKKQHTLSPVVNVEHDKKKNYILKEGSIIPPLIDLGVFTKDGSIVKTMYDKYRQINRFIEIIDDTIRVSNFSHLNIIDFGCGKSYLTFILYYYLTEIRNIETNIIGLDLKEDVICNCNHTAQKYGYNNLKFEVGDINGFKAPFDVDIVISLHACDVATDYALFNAIEWKAKMIFSVPCCHHELNSQIKASNLSIITKHGIIKERISALITDSIRSNLLEYCGYSSQLLEFIDMEHTPKNILIRAIKKKGNYSVTARKALDEVKKIMNEFNLSPTLYNLLLKNGDID